MLNEGGDKYCDAVAKKCKAGDKKACALYKKKCEKVLPTEIIVISYNTFLIE